MTTQDEDRLAKAMPGRAAELARIEKMAAQAAAKPLAEDRSGTNDDGTAWRVCNG